MSGDINRIIECVVAINDLKELEIKIEHLGFECDLHDNGIIIYHPNEKFEQCLEISELMSSIQKNATLLLAKEINQDYKSVEEFLELAYKIYPNMIEYKPGTYSRFRMLLPPAIVKFIAEQFDNFIFLENIYILEDIKKTLYLNPDELEEYIIKDSFTLYDFVKFHNVIWLINNLQRKKILEFIAHTNIIVILRSLVPTFSKDEIIDIFKYVEEDQSKIECFLDMLSWRYGNNCFLDLQYQPVIYHRNTYHVLSSVMAMSRLSRNIFPLESKKGNIIKNKQERLLEPISQIIKHDLEKRGFIVFTEVPIKYKSSLQKECDIDVFAIKDDLIIVLECKDIIEYTTVYELRTSFDQVNKAVSQLNYISEALLDKEYFNNLLRNYLKINKHNDYHIQFGIILSNKSFWGITIDGYPIRSLHEFLGLLEHGTLMLKEPEGEKFIFKTWSGLDFDKKDILKFFSEASFHKYFYDYLYKDMVKVTNKVFINKYGLDMNALINKLKIKGS